MADTLGDMVTRIKAEMLRPDLETQIRAAIADAIAAYAKERFRFSETLPLDVDNQFYTVANEWIYKASDIPTVPIASLFKIDSAFILIGNTQIGLVKQDPDVIFGYNQSGTMVGQPSWWGYRDNAFLLSCVPDKAYQITLEFFRNVVGPASDIEANNPWMMVSAGERLIRCRAKYELAVHVVRNPTMRDAMDPRPPGPGEKGGEAWLAYSELKRVTNRVTAGGRIKPMQF
jgi:hypothetical protein